MRADLALIGFGHVGRRFLTLLEDRRDHLLREFRLDCRVVGIATARHGAVATLEGIDTRVAIARRIAGQHLGSDGTSMDVIICQMAGDLTQTAYALFSDLVTIARRAGSTLS